MRRISVLLVAAARRFYDDGCFMRASALAYASLLSLVPLLAVMFSVLKGLGVQRRLEPFLLARLSLSPDTTEAIIGYIDRTNFATLGAFGAITLLLTVYSLLSSIEASFNAIWRVPRGRNHWQQLSHYFSVVLLTPFLLLGAVALTSSFQVQQLIEWARRSEILGEAIVAALGSAPVVMNIVGLAVLYAIMPNRRPYWPSVLLGAIVAGVAWQVVQVTYLRLQFGVARYNAIYGALSQLPVTLVWQYLSWLIVLAGAEIAVVYEHDDETGRAETAPPTRIAIALELLLRSASAFADATPPLRLRDVARDLRAPSDVVHEVAAWLVEQRWLAIVEGEEAQYVLAVDGAHIRLGKLATLGCDMQPPSGCSREVRQVLAQLAAVQTTGWDQWSLADALQQRSEERR